MKYFKTTALVFVSTLINFLFSYLFHFVIGRLLGPADYGRFGVVNNLIWIASIFNAPISTIIIKYGAYFHAKGDKEKLKSLILGVIKTSLKINIILATIFIIFNQQISGVLGSDINTLVILTALSFPIAGLITVFLPLFQSIGDYKRYSIINAVSSLIKLIFVILLIYLGFKANSTLLSIIISSAIIVGICFIIFRDYLNANKKIKINYLKFGLSVLLTNVFINLIYYFDLFFVKSFLGAEDAGIYGAAVTLSRVFLLSSSIMAVFFPEFNKNIAKENKIRKSNIKYALVYVGGICILGLIAYWSAPQLILEITYSNKYLESASILKVLSIGYVFNALFSVISGIYFATNKHWELGAIGLVHFIADFILLYTFTPHGLIYTSYITTLISASLFFTSLIFLKISKNF